MEKKYRPSNSSEGDHFMSKYCNQCLHDNPDPDQKPKCDILTASMVFDLEDPEYPKEWVYRKGKGTCLSFQKWDWDDGDPWDPDNPLRPPDPPDPRQLPLFTLYPVFTLTPEECQPSPKLPEKLKQQVSSSNSGRVNLMS